MIPSPVRGAAWSTLASLLIGLACSSAARADSNESGDRPLQHAAITAGGTHTCALSGAGDVRCWGGDASGQLGDGTPLANRSTPSARIALPLPARAITAGNSHTCALLSDGAVRCWGDDDSGQLGDGAPARDTASPAAPVALGQPARAISAGYDHTCAVLADGAVRCWGSDAVGQLGDGPSLTSTTAPAAAVALGGPAVAVSAGDSFTCALRADGAVRCWGDDSAGELGDGLPYRDTATPAATVALGRAATAISAGVGHACAVLAGSGQVRCWGWNDNEQLGITGVRTTAAPATPVALSARARSVTTGFRHTCATLSDDTVRCWGYDGDGQLGDGLPDADTEVPVLVKLGQPAHAVSAGDWHTCALTTAATLRCWSNDNEGQLGDGAPNQTRNAPSTAVALPAFASPDSADTELLLSARETVSIGEQFTVTVRQLNTGPDATTSTVAVPLPAGFALDQATPDHGEYRADTGQWIVGPLEANGLATLVLKAHAVAPTTTTLVAETTAASAQDPDSTPGDHVATQDDRRTLPLTAVAATPAPTPPPPATPAPQLRPTRLTLTVAPRRTHRTPLLYAATLRLTSGRTPLAGLCRGTARVVVATTGAKRKTLTRTVVTLRRTHGRCEARKRLRIPASRALRATKRLTVTASYDGTSLVGPSRAKRTIALKRPIAFAGR